MNVLRTPDERFAGLPDFDHPPQYLQQGALRLHYVDAGPRAAAVTALCLHGEPTWAYLYRRMIPLFTAAGLRVIAPDFFGFGRSDKPDDDAWYSFERHRDSILALIDALDLRNLLLVCQDWGGLIGLTLPMAYQTASKTPSASAPQGGAAGLGRPGAGPDQFTRLLVMNTGLGTGTVTEGFKAWRAYCNANPDLAVGKLMRRACPHLTDAEAAAYDAPFPDMRHKAGVRAFPNLVPDREDAPGAAISRAAGRFWKEDFAGQSFMAIGMQDPVLGPAAMRSLHKLIRGCPPPMEVADGGHFVQEWGAPVAQAALQHFGLA